MTKWHPSYRLECFLSTHLKHSSTSWALLFSWTWLHSNLGNTIHAVTALEVNIMRYTENVDNSFIIEMQLRNIGKDAVRKNVVINVMNMKVPYKLSSTIQISACMLTIKINRFSYEAHSQGTHLPQGDRYIQNERNSRETHPIFSSFFHESEATICP